jgi:hypothetical protein
LHGEVISSAAIFKGRSATIDYARISQSNADLAFRGQIDFGQWPRLEIALTPNLALDAAMPDPAECVGALEMSPSSVSLPVGLGVQQIVLRGGLFASDWVIDLIQRPAPDAGSITRSFPLCPSGKPLSLARSPAWFP